MNSKSFARKLEALAKRLDSELALLISRPNERNIHDIRTTIRRTQALYDLLPKKLRRENRVSGFLATTRGLFKSTSKIRDIDIVEMKVREFAATPELEEFLQSQGAKRTHLIRSTTRSARSLKTRSVPSFTAGQIADPKLEKRMKKVTKKLEFQLEDRFKVMQDNPSIAHLHHFRKTCKMLRYTLEIDSILNKKMIATLEGLQKTLGVILDNYTTIGSVSGFSKEDIVKLLIAKLESENETAYGDLVLFSKKQYGASIDIQALRRAIAQSMQ